MLDYGELDKKTLNHSGSIPKMESTLENIASCRYKTKMDKRSGFWQVDLTPNAQELVAFITPQGRVFKWKVIPFAVANAPAHFQERMNKILSILRRRPVVQELISRGAQMEAHIDDVCLGSKTLEDHLILLGEFFAVCKKNHTRLKPEKCEFMQETMQYQGSGIMALPRSIIHINTAAYNMLYIACMVIVNGHDIRKISFPNFDF